MRREVWSRSIWLSRPAWCALALAWVATGCNQADETSLEPGPRDGLGGSSGGGGSTASSAGQGGSTPQIDAGMDATADATSPVAQCEHGLLATYCANSPCPAFDAARPALRDTMGFQTPVVAIVQRSCVAPNGSARVSVGADYISWTRTFIYDAETHLLTGVVLSNDLGIRCASDGDILSGRHGEFAPDCEWQGVGSGCEASGAGDAGSDDAGPGDAGLLGQPLECVLTP